MNHSSRVSFTFRWRVVLLAALFFIGLGCDGTTNEINNQAECSSDEICAMHASADQRGGHGIWLTEENVLCREIEGGSKRCSECLENEDCADGYRCSGQTSCVEGERNRSRCETDEECATFAMSPTFRDKFHDTDAVVCAELEDGFMNCSECPPGVDCPEGLSCVDGTFCQ